MRILWTDEALDDLAEIVTCYDAKASSSTAKLVERRIIQHVERLPPLPERIRKSDKITGAHELVVNRLPYIVFVKLRPEEIVVLNVVHTARKFPP